MTAPQSPSSPKRERDRDHVHRAAMDGSPTKRRRQGAGGDGLTTPPPSTSSSAIAGPSTSSSPRRRSPRLVQRVAGQTQAGPSGPLDATGTIPSGTTAPRRRPAQTQASASSSASASTSHSSPIMPLRSRTAPGPRRGTGGSLGLESETGCRRPTAAAAPTMRPPPPPPRPSTSGGPSDPPSSSPSSLLNRRPLGEMTLADADRQARAIRSRHEEVEERQFAAEAATTSSNDPPATPSRSPATGATRRTFSLGRRSTPRRTASSSSAGPSVARRGPVPTPSSVSFIPSSDALNEDEASFSTSSTFDDSLASTSTTSAADAMPATPRDGQPILGVAEMAAVARYHAHAPSSPSGAPRTPSSRRGQASDEGQQQQLESPPSDENDDSPGRERRRRREAAAAAAVMAAEKARHEEEGGAGEDEDGEPVLLEKGDYREVVAGRAMRGGGGRVGMS